MAHSEEENVLEPSPLADLVLKVDDLLLVVRQKVCDGERKCLQDLAHRWRVLVLGVLCVLHTLGELFEVQEVPSCLHHVLEEPLVHAELHQRGPPTLVVRGHVDPPVSVHAEGERLLDQVEDTRGGDSLKEQEALVDEVGLGEDALVSFAGELIPRLYDAVLEVAQLLLEAQHLLGRDEGVLTHLEPVHLVVEVLVLPEILDAALCAQVALELALVDIGEEGDQEFSPLFFLLLGCEPPEVFIDLF